MMKVDFTPLGSIGTPKCPIKNAIRVVKFNQTTPSSPIILSCPAALSLSNWIDEAGVSSFSHMGTLNCRKVRGANIQSEHSYGTAIDIAGINGISIKGNWGRDNPQGRVLSKAADIACHHFSNVITPETNSLHHDHLHFDIGFGAMCGDSRFW